MLGKHHFAHTTLIKGSAAPDRMKQCSSLLTKLFTTSKYSHCTFFENRLAKTRTWLQLLFYPTLVLCYFLKMEEINECFSHNQGPTQLILRFVNFLMLCHYNVSRDRACPRASDFHVKLHLDFISCQITAGSPGRHPPKRQIMMS